MATVDIWGNAVRMDADLVLPHEHIIIDMSCYLEDSDAGDVAETVTDLNLSVVRARPYAFRDNLKLDDPAVAATELDETRACAPVIIDVTPTGLGRSPEKVRRFATITRAQVIMGCGRYVASARRHEVRRDPAFYRDEILDHLLQGSDGVRAGIIGEIGASTPLADIEISTLRGAAEAQKRTGALLFVHLNPWIPSAHEALDEIERVGGDVARTVLCHLDGSLLRTDISFHCGLIRRGAIVAFDMWGDELVYHGNTQPSDERRIEALLELAHRGYGSRMIHSHDICTKTQLRRFGGPGFAHLPQVVFPRLLEHGLSDADVQALFLEPALVLLRG
jgi:phosphotriesterase-related protein